MKPESLVIANQPRRGEYVLESCTHCPSLQGSREYLKSPFGDKGKLGDMAEVVEVNYFVATFGR